MSRFRKGASVALSLALVLAVAPAAFASTINESLAVNSTLTVTGVPASITYAATDPGATTPAVPVNATVVTNAPGWELRMSGSDFTGPATINKIQREAQIDQPSFGTSAATSFTNFANAAFNGTNVTASGPSGSSNVSMQFRVNVPANQTPGAYSGTITYFFTAN